MQYTLDTDFGSLNGPKAANWLRALEGKMLEEAFAGRDDSVRLLGNLLILEPFAHTLRQGLESKGEHLHPLVEPCLDRLWDVLEKHSSPKEFQELANNLYACVLEHNVGEELSQDTFWREHFRDELDVFSWLFLEWVSVLMLGLISIKGGRLDYDGFESYRQVDFYGQAELVNILQDACVELTGTPMPSSRARDVEAAFEQVTQTELFRGVIAQIQKGLKAALSAQPGKYAALREEYRQATLLPARYAAELLEY